MIQGWAMLFCLLTELASAMSLYNSAMHLYFKIFCHSGLGKTSLSQIWLCLQLWEPHFCQSVSLLPPHSLLYWLCLSKVKSRMVWGGKFLVGTGVKPQSSLLKSKLSFTWWQSRLIGLQACKTGNTLQKTLWRKADFKLYYFKHLLTSFSQGPLGFEVVFFRIKIQQDFIFKTNIRINWISALLYQDYQVLESKRHLAESFWLWPTFGVVRPGWILVLQNSSKDSSLLSSFVCKSPRRRDSKSTLCSWCIQQEIHRICTPYLASNLKQKSLCFSLNNLLRLDPP